MQETVISIMVILLFLVGGIWLQVFLSKKNNKWLGLIIPIICFMFSITIVFSLSMFNTATTSVIETIDGAEVTNKTTTLQSDKPSVISMLVTVTPVFFISNIPTVIFLAIYFACREKIKIRNELDKMNIQDLE